MSKPGKVFEAPQDLALALLVLLQGSFGANFIRYIGLQGRVSEVIIIQRSKQNVGKQTLTDRLFSPCLMGSLTWMSKLLFCASSCMHTMLSR